MEVLKERRVVAGWTRRDFERRHLVALLRNDQDEVRVLDLQAIDVSIESSATHTLSQRAGMEGSTHLALLELDRLHSAPAHFLLCREQQRLLAHEHELVVDEEHQLLLPLPSIAIESE